MPLRAQTRTCSFSGWPSTSRTAKGRKNKRSKGQARRSHPMCQHWLRAGRCGDSEAAERGVASMNICGGMCKTCWSLCHAPGMLKLGGGGGGGRGEANECAGRSERQRAQGKVRAVLIAHGEARWGMFSFSTVVVGGEKHKDKSHSALRNHQGAECLVEGGPTGKPLPLACRKFSVADSAACQTRPASKSSHNRNALYLGCQTPGIAKSWIF